MSRSALYRRLQQYGVRSSQPRSSGAVRTGPSIGASSRSVFLLVAARRAAGRRSRSSTSSGGRTTASRSAGRWRRSSCVVWIGCARGRRTRWCTRVLFLAGNLLGALREGDYSIRGTGAQAGQRRRSRDERDQLARRHAAAPAHRSGRIDRAAASVMGAIDVAVFAFDMDEQLVLVNPAGERLLGQARGAPARARRASELRLANCLDGDTPRLIDRAVRPRERPPRAAALDVPPRRQAASAARLRRPEPRAARTGAAGLAAHRPRAVARDQQLADADQVDRAQHQADDLARAGHPARRRDPGRPQPDRDAVGRARPVPARLRAARAAAEAAAAADPDRCRSRAASRSSRTACRSSVTASDRRRDRSRSGSARAAADQHRPQRRRRDARDGRPGVDRLEAGRRLAAAHRRGRRAGAARHVQPVRAVLHDQADGLGHRPRAAAGRSPKRTAARSALENRTDGRGCRAVLRLPM